MVTLSSTRYTYSNWVWGFSFAINIGQFLSQNKKTPCPLPTAIIIDVLRTNGLIYRTPGFNFIRLLSLLWLSGLRISRTSEFSVCLMTWVDVGKVSGYFFIRWIIFLKIFTIIKILNSIQRSFMVFYYYILVLADPDTPCYG